MIVTGLAFFYPVLVLEIIPPKEHPFDLSNTNSLFAIETKKSIVT